MTRASPSSTAVAGARREPPERFKVVNLDRHEYLDPDALGWRAGGSRRGRARVLEVLAALLAVSEGEDALLGRWSGERIVLIGKRSDPDLYRWVTEGASMRELSGVLRASELGEPGAAVGSPAPLNGE